jgi:hypothetical protein
MTNEYGDILMPRPTHADAIAYVCRMERGWHTCDVNPYSVKDAPENCVDVQTARYAWTVWTQTDGTIYGEC